MVDKLSGSISPIVNSSLADATKSLNESMSSGNALSPNAITCLTPELAFTPAIDRAFSWEAMTTVAPQSFATNSTSDGVSMTLIGLITAPVFSAP